MLFRRVGVVLAMILNLMPGTAGATSFFDDAVGVITDPLGARRASSTLADSAERTVAGIRELEDKTNKDFSDRLEQVRTIVKSVTDAVNQNTADLSRTVKRATAEMQALERRTNKDLMELVDRVGCISEVATQDQIQRGLSKVISELISAQPGIKFLGIRILRTDLKEVEIVNPDEAYESTKKAMLIQLDLIKDDDAAMKILSTYQNLARFAGFAKCYYLGLGLDTVYAAEQRRYVRLSEPWLRFVESAP